MLTGGSLDDWAKNPEYVLEATRLSFSLEGLFAPYSGLCIISLHSDRFILGGSHNCLCVT